MRLKLPITSIFMMSDRAAFRGTFRIEANQRSKAELYTCNIPSYLNSGRLHAVKHFPTEISHRKFKFHLRCLTAFPLGENNKNWIQLNLLVKHRHGQ